MAKVEPRTKFRLELGLRIAALSMIAFFWFPSVQASVPLQIFFGIAVFANLGMIVVMLFRGK